MAFLDEIITKKRAEIVISRRKHNIGDLKRMFKDTPPVRPFYDGLARGFGLIAEIKRKSPSAGPMREENFRDAAAAYDKSPIVKAVSVLTDTDYFGMELKDLLRIKSQVHQPVLRKDFIVKEFQIYEARAYGADAVLLMANVLKNKEDLKRIYDIVREVGMEALFEAHTEAEIELIPDGATIYGLNSRKFMAQKRWVAARFMAKSKFFARIWRPGKAPDPSVDLGTFNLIKHLPQHAIKVAESGVSPKKARIIKDLGFDSILVGTSLLKDIRGINAALSEFEDAIQGVTSPSFTHSPVHSPA